MMARIVNHELLIAETFKHLERLAVAGDRCPTRDQGLDGKYVKALADAGKIAVEVSTHNWRRITILVGPHAGKATAPNPLPRSSVYMTIDKTGTRRNGRAVDVGASSRQQPSAPKLLPYAGRGR
jgi:hypothetical protein